MSEPTKAEILEALEAKTIQLRDVTIAFQAKKKTLEDAFAQSPENQALQRAQTEYQVALTAFNRCVAPDAA